MKTLFYTLFSLLVVNFNLIGQTTTTINNGNWTAGGNWSNGVPGWGVSATISNDMILNTNLSIGTDSNHLVNGGSITDLPGGTVYNISLNGFGSLTVNNGNLNIEGDMNISNSGDFTVDGSATVGGDFNLSNSGNLSVKGCDTLRIKGNARFVNTSTVTVEACAVLIVDGNLDMNNNNSNNIDGNVLVGGNLTGTNNASVYGDGNLQVEGQVDLKNGSNVFGSTDDCGGSCSYGTGSGLPIELSYFDAKVNSDGLIEANWETATEINNDYFTIEVSTNGVDYSAAGKVSGAGNSNVFIQYKSIVEPLNAEVNYIRLRQTDYDGQSKSFKPVAVTINTTDSKKESDFSIYPNPGSRNNLNVELNAAHIGEYTVEVMDSKGSILASKRVYNGNEDFSERFELLNGIQLNSGVYFVRAYNAEETLTLKYIVR